MIRSPLAGDHRLLPVGLLLTAVLAALLALGAQSRRAFSIPLYARPVSPVRPVIPLFWN